MYIQTPSRYGSFRNPSLPGTLRSLSCLEPNLNHATDLIRQCAIAMPFEVETIRANTLWVVIVENWVLYFSNSRYYDGANSKRYA